MEEREKLLKQLHSHLLCLTQMDSYPEGGVYEENFIQYAFTCMIQGFITNRLFQWLHIPFPEIPYPESLREGLYEAYYNKLFREFSSLDLNDCFFAIENFGLNIHFLGVELSDRENSIMELELKLRELIRSRWIFFGKDINYVEMDMIIGIPGLGTFFQKREANRLSLIEEQLLDLCLQNVPNHLYSLNPVLILPDGDSSGYIHLLQFSSTETPFASSCYITRTLFFTVYILAVLCGAVTIPREGGA